MQVDQQTLLSLLNRRFDPALTLAQAIAESNLDTAARRFEKAVYDRFIQQGISPGKAQLKATSWGLFQIMGYNLENMGYPVTNLEWLNNYLNDPALQVESFLKFSWQLLNDHKGDIRKYLAAYNGGQGAVNAEKSNGFFGPAEPYVQKVLKIAKLWNPETDGPRAEAYEKKKSGRSVKSSQVSASQP